MPSQLARIVRGPGLPRKEEAFAEEECTAVHAPRLTMAPAFPTLLPTQDLRSVPTTGLPLDSAELKPAPKTLLLDMARFSLEVVT